MQAWQIFTHSLRQVVGNFEAALRVSAVLFIVKEAIQGLLGSPGLNPEGQLQGLETAGTGYLLGIVASALVGLFCLMWIAVGWHRYVLLDERPGIVPKLHQGRIAGYFGKGIAIALLWMVPAMAGFFILMLLTRNLGGEAHAYSPLLNFVFVILPCAAAMMRMSTMLPGAALQEGVQISLGWTSTKGAMATFVVLTLMWGLLTKLHSQIGIWTLSDLPVLAFVWQFLGSWCLMMLGLSLLTTLYGHYVEKRPLV